MNSRFPKLRRIKIPQKVADATQEATNSVAHFSLEFIAVAITYSYKFVNWFFTIKRDRRLMIKLLKQHREYERQCRQAEQSKG